MKPKKYFFLLAIFFSIYSCKNADQKAINYEEIVEEVLHDSTTVDNSDTANILDGAFDPAKDSLSELLDTLQNVLTNDSFQIKKYKVNDSGLLTQNPDKDTVLSNPKDSFSNQIKKVNTDEIRALKYNLKQLNSADSLALATLEGPRTQKEARIWAHVKKDEQKLYLYIDGKAVDTFLVSSGNKGHETPKMDQRPNGPSFQKYTSKKYPGGNYKGLGNMPYVVFIRGGYGIHGTTKGNIPRLGKKASHGCIRLHPDNAKIFFELVRKAGLENTWVTIE